MFNWLKKNNNSSENELKNESDVMPKTELSTSRQALNNISIGLNVDNVAIEEAASSSGIKFNKQGIFRVCSNRFCCGDDIQNAINNEHRNRSTFIDNVYIETDNDETESRRTEIINNKSYSFIEFYDPYADYCKLECPDSPLNSIIISSNDDLKSTYMRLKKKQIRNKLGNNFDIFTTQKCEISNEISHLNYEVLSKLEEKLEFCDYNLDEVRDYNRRYRRAQRQNHQISTWNYEDFKDDPTCIRNHDDTIAIKEFYKLTVTGDVHLHFHYIDVETGVSNESFGASSLCNFIKWFIFKGHEITEFHYVKEESTSIIEVIKNFFKKSKLKTSNDYVNFATTKEKEKVKCKFIFIYIIRKVIKANNKNNSFQRFLFFLSIPMGQRKLFFFVKNKREEEREQFRNHKN